jgi:hypothetical protein
MRFAVHARRLRPGETAPESVTAEDNPNRKPFNIPSQIRLAEITASRAAVLMRPGTNRLYFYQPRDGGIDWYAGNTTTVQGIYRNFTGRVTANSFIAAVYDGEERRLYLAADNFNNQKGISIFSSYSPAGSLSTHGRATPYGADAKYPALTFEDGVTWLFYTVADNAGERLYRVRIRDRRALGEPELLRTLPAGSGARPLGRYVVDGAPVLFWHDTGSKKVYGAWAGGHAFETQLTGSADRVTMYGNVSGGRLRAVSEKDGRLSFHSFDLSTLPPKPVPSPEPDDAEQEPPE